MSFIDRGEAVVAGLRAAWWEAGRARDGRPPLVLLHGGAWGECAEAAWAEVVPLLAAGGRRVVAPDWLGFGGSDMVVDFADRQGRMLSHLAALLRHLDVDEIDAVGLSMGGAVLLRDLTAKEPVLPVRRAVLASAGGPPLNGGARRRLMDFDGTFESMLAQVRLPLPAATAPAADAPPSPWERAQVEMRLRAALTPGAFEAFSSLRLAPPPAPAGDSAPLPQEPPYEDIRVPVLLLAGAEDPLKPMAEIVPLVAARIPRPRTRLLAGRGHCPQLEDPRQWCAAVLEFLDDDEPERPAPPARGGAAERD